MEKKIFDKQFVHFMWNDSLEGKEGFATDNIYALQRGVEENNTECRYTVNGLGSESFPFGTAVICKFRFFYYDPLYDVKWAWKQGKRIQCRAPSGTWLDAATPNWDNKALEFRVKPDEPVYRPFKDIQELKSTFLNLLPFAAIPANTEPSIWVRSKSNVQSTFMITHFCENMGVVYLSGHLNMGIEQLFADYTFLDGTPCGVKEE